MIAFGPVPSRRLGRSLGINNIPPKVCTYACVYCQVGRTIKMQADRKEFYPVQRILRDVRDRIEKVKAKGDRIDYLTFVPDGEPILDIHLGREIEMLGRFGIKIAVITNSSLLWDADVRKELAKADWVPVKVDSVNETAWRSLNRPHPPMKLDSVLRGIIEFSKNYSGIRTTETMLLKDLNEQAEHIEETARFLNSIQPDRSYLAIPTRPPAMPEVRSPDEASLHRSHQIFQRYLDHVEYLIGYEGNAYSFTGDAEEDILRITAVHPMREDAVMAFLERSYADWQIMEKLLAEKNLIETEYSGKQFYVRRLHQ